MNYDYDPYVVLGISPQASTDDIKRAYRKLAQRLHPDKNPLPAAEEQFQTVNTAYNLLMDSVMRRRYDDQLAKLKADNPGYFTLRVTPSRRAIMPLPEPQVMYLLAELGASPDTAEEEEQKEVNINLTLVIDQSNSMHDERRMDKIKAAAQEIIKQLTPKDYLSVVSFNDRASVIIQAQRAAEPANLAARISMIKPSGGTEIFQGLEEGVKQSQAFLDKKLVNHLILLTDGRTYGDEDECLALAQKAKDQGISITAMGLGSDWNDRFLDELASLTGGRSMYVQKINEVYDFLENEVRNLSDIYAERMQLLIAPDADIELEMAFKLTPSPQELPHEKGIVSLAGLQAKRPISVLLQYQLPGGMSDGYRSLSRLVVTGDILQNKHQHFSAISDINMQVTTRPPQDDKPPRSIVDALSRLALYRLQEKAQDAMNDGDYDEATRRLEFLATRLYDMGEEKLGQQALLEAQHVKHTRSFTSDESKLTLKYSTRSLVGTAGLEQGITSLFENDGNDPLRSRHFDTDDDADQSNKG